MSVGTNTASLYSEMASVVHDCKLPFKRGYLRKLIPCCFGGSQTWSVRPLPAASSQHRHCRNLDLIGHDLLYASRVAFSFVRCPHKIIGLRSILRGLRSLRDVCLVLISILVINRLITIPISDNQFVSVGCAAVSRFCTEISNFQKSNGSIYTMSHRPQPSSLALSCLVIIVFPRFVEPIRIHRQRLLPTVSEVRGFFDFRCLTSDT